MRKKTIDARVRNRRLALPNKFVVALVLIFFRRIARRDNVEFVYHYDVEKYRKKQVILLGQHAAHDDFIWAPSGYIGKTPNYVGGLYHFYYRLQHHLLKWVGAIPKYLYQIDFQAIKDIDTIINKGGSIAFFPEGIQSTSGSNHPINPASVKLLMKYKLPVILYKSCGGYLTNPRFSKKNRRGKVICSYELLFEPQDFEKYNAEDLYRILMEHFRYNDFTYNQKARIAYKGEVPNAEGLDKILYKCPHCLSEFHLKVAQDSLVCQDCGCQVRVDEFYDLHFTNSSRVFPNIDAWYKWQRECVVQEVADPNFEIKVPCYLLGIEKYKLKKDPEIKLGQGEMIIHRQGVSYHGMVEGTYQELFFDIRLIPSMPFTPGKNLDMHYQNAYYGFEPIEEKNRVVKWMIISEELHNLVNEKWAKVSADAYRDDFERK